MSDAREALMALIRGEYAKHPVDRYPTEGALADAILAEFDVTERGEGCDADLRAEVERLRGALDVARADRNNAVRDWRETRQQVADLRRSFSRAVERTAKRIERMGQTVRTELAAGLVREMTQPVALEAAREAHDG